MVDPQFSRTPWYQHEVTAICVIALLVLGVITMVFITVIAWLQPMLESLRQLGVL